MRSKIYKVLAGCLALVAVAGGVWYITNDRGPIYEFNEQRDTQDILDIFKSDWYWLVADTPENYSPEFMLKYRAPQQNRMYSGQMYIKVLRDKQNQFVGFVAYYFKTKTRAFLNFLAVKPELRGKRYADKLMAYALQDLKDLGAQRVDLITRPSNTRAQAVYKRFGFEENFNDGNFVGFSYFFK